MQKHPELELIPTNLSPYELAIYGNPERKTRLQARRADDRRRLGQTLQGLGADVGLGFPVLAQEFVNQVEHGHVGSFVCLNLEQADGKSKK